MGSYNGTCAITNLPILGGEDVYVMLLLEGRSYDKYIGHHCYSNTYYTPLPLMFEGKYNDYGSVESCGGDFLEDIIEIIKDNLFEMEQGENQYHDIAVEKDDFDIELLFDADHEGRLFVQPSSFEKPRGVEKSRLTTIMIRKDVMEKFLKDYTVEYLTPKSYMDAKIKFHKAIEKFYPMFKKSITKNIKTYSSMDSHGAEFAKAIMALDKHFNNIPVCKVFDNYSVKQHVVDPNKLVRKYWKDDDMLKKLYTNFAMVGWLDIFMDRSRGQWIKPSGSGSQNSESDAQKMKASLINHGAKMLKKKFDEDDY
jgi:hypothetical protein